MAALLVECLEWMSWARNTQVSQKQMEEMRMLGSPANMRRGRRLEGSVFLLKSYCLNILNVVGCYFRKVSKLEQVHRHSRLHIIALEYSTISIIIDTVALISHSLKNFIFFSTCMLLCVLKFLLYVDLWFCHVFAHT